MKLTSLYLHGFMSFDKRRHELPLGDVTVLLGANGSGKSNVLSFFKMLQSLATRDLTNFVGKYGDNRLLHYGSKHTTSIPLQLFFDEGYYRYIVILCHALPDGFLVRNEKIAYNQKVPDEQKDIPSNKHSHPDDTKFKRVSYYIKPGPRGEAGLAYDDHKPSLLIKS